MLANSSYKKVRSISEGNFHSCYASNKAEKFKFRRLSQGLESCAQAQALKLRKEEKELLRLYQNIEKEKEKNEYERRYNQYYLQMKKSPDGMRDEGSSNSLHLASSTSRNLVRLAPIQKKGKSFHAIEQRPPKGPRRRSLPTHQNSTEVIPFYLQHGYTHYHHDSHYDNLIDPKASGTHLSDDSSGVIDQPCWKKNSKVSRLRYRRSAITSINSEHKAFLRKFHEEAGKVGSVSSLKIDDSECSLKSELKDNQYYPSNISNRTMLEFPVKPSDLKSNVSVLTPFERQELAKYQHRSLRNLESASGDEIERRGKHLFEMQRGRRHTIPSIKSNSKLQILRQILMKKLASGYEMKDLAKDEIFSGVLDLVDDGHLYHAYDPDIEYTLEDFYALRKCKYLRLSNLNKQSLTEATLETIANDKKSISNLY